MHKTNAVSVANQMPTKDSFLANDLQANSRARGSQHDESSFARRACMGQAADATPSGSYGIVLSAQNYTCTGCKLSAAAVSDMNSSTEPKREPEN